MDLNQLNKIYNTQYFSIWEMIQTIPIAEEHLLELVNDLPTYWVCAINYQKVSIDFINQYIIACQNSNKEINWNVISKKSNLPNEFMDKYKKQLNWTVISEFHELSLEFIQRYESDIYWIFINSNLSITDEIILKYLRRMDFGILSGNSNVSENIIEKFWIRFNRTKLLQTKELSQEFIRKNILRIGIDCNMIIYQYIPEDVIIEHMDIFKDWLYLISKRQKLSSEFLMKYGHYINSKTLCEHQSLSEKFMHQYRNYLDWSLVSRFQKLSLDFIKQHEQFINFEWLSTNAHITIDVLEAYESRINWKYVLLYNPYINIKQICKYQQKSIISPNIIKSMTSTKINKELLLSVINKKKPT